MEVIEVKDHNAVKAFHQVSHDIYKGVLVLFLTRIGPIHLVSLLVGAVFLNASKIRKRLTYCLILPKHGSQHGEWKPWMVLLILART